MMEKRLDLDQHTSIYLSKENRPEKRDLIPIWIDRFLISRRSNGAVKGTIQYYKENLARFNSFCAGRMIEQISQIAPDDIREYMLQLEAEGHNPGGRHIAYRTLRTFLKWYWDEAEPEGRNPYLKVKAPHIDIEPLTPVPLEDIDKLIDICDKATLMGARDQALFSMLLDTGCRAQELLSLNIEDLDLSTQSGLVKRGKMGKMRTVFVGKKTRANVRAYLKLRGEDKEPALFITKDGTRLTYAGLRQVVRRRSEQAGISTPPIHSFRRAFAINSLRNGMDVISLQRILGHSSLKVISRYLALVTDDLYEAHSRTNPMDNRR